MNWAETEIRGGDRGRGGDWERGWRLVSLMEMTCR